MDWQPFTEPGTQARPWPAGRFVSPRRAAALAWVSLRAMIASQIRAAIPAVANALSANGVPLEEVDRFLVGKPRSAPRARTASSLVHRYLHLVGDPPGALVLHPGGAGAVHRRRGGVPGLLEDARVVGASRFPALHPGWRARPGHRCRSVVPPSPQSTAPPGSSQDSSTAASAAAGSCAIGGERPRAGSATARSAGGDLPWPPPPRPGGAWSPGRRRTAGPPQPGRSGSSSPEGERRRRCRGRQYSPGDQDSTARGLLPVPALKRKVCGRFTLAARPQDLQQEFPDFWFPSDLPPRYNIAPSQQTLVLPGDGAFQARSMRWGLVPAWARDPAIGNRMINARSETVLERPAFRSAFRKRRCLVCADGFYEWQGSPPRRRPFHITLPGGVPFAMAGIWEEWPSPEGENLSTFALLTTRANPDLRAIHDRMPVILGPEARPVWLDPTRPPDALLDLLVPFPGRLELRAVSRFVNRPGNEGPECLAAAES